MSGRRIIRVFPRRTRATPVDELVRVDAPPGLFDECDEVHVSCSFTWDRPRAEWLARQWEHVAPVHVGGPAYGDRGGEFVPGRYLRNGYVITSRGCPNCCWFCDAWRREGREVRELPVRDGWNVLDSNLLACSDGHIRAVVAMLSRQGHRAEFTGGLEAARLRPWHAELLAGLTPRPAVWLAYDTRDDREPLAAAADLLRRHGWTPESHRLRCYVLCGYPGDSFAAAEERLMFALSCGCMPMAMVHRDGVEPRDDDWTRWQRAWARPALIAMR